MYMKIKNEQPKILTQPKIDSTKRWTFEGIEYGIPEIVLFGFDDARKAIPLTEHYHVKSFEFVYIERGKAGWETSEGQFETRTGEVFYTLPDENHRGSFNIIEPCRFWWIILQIPSAQTESVEKRWLGLEETEAYQLLEVLHSLPRVSKPETPILLSLQRIRAAIQRNDPLVTVEIRISILDFLLSLKLPKPKSFIPSGLLSSMERIKDEISLRLDWNPRLSEAAKLLKETEHSITDIAFILGFSSTQHFATAFRRLMGQTPTNWRLNP
jgi:hypothetical protein